MGSVVQRGEAKALQEPDTLGAEMFTYAKVAVPATLDQDDGNAVSCQGEGRSEPGWSSPKNQDATTLRQCH
jgi:hypothetical protein